MASPSDYGAYVFQSTCGDHLIAAYKNRAATYNSTQQFVIAVACIIILVSFMGLLRQLLRSRPRANAAERSECRPRDNRS